MILGIHGSVRTGLLNALGEAQATGCETLQLLPFRRHFPPTEDELGAFRAERRRLALRHLIVHSRFVPSLASGDSQRRERTVELLAYELTLAKGLGADGYVLHAGAYSESDSLEAGLHLAADSIARGVEKAAFDAPILIENVPGGGRRLCGPLEQVARLRDAIGRRLRTGVCLDTAHAYAEGYDIASAEGMLRFLSRAARLFGDEVRLFHVNDTRALLGSHKEDHAHWGQGRLGSEGVRTLLERPEYADTPAIVETPKEPGADRRNLEYLGSL